MAIPVKMIMKKKSYSRAERVVPLDIPASEFRAAGRALVDDIARLLETMRKRKLTTARSPLQIRSLLAPDQLPRNSGRPARILRDARRLLLADSLFNGHPGFWGYVTSSPAPIGVLADLLASGINQNVGAFVLSPVATEIEAQTIRWISDLIGYPRDCGGILVSGGNTANFVGFLAARRKKAPWNIRKEGIGHGAKRLRVYCSDETHTWIQKAADMYGLGTDAIGFIPTDSHQRMDLKALERQLKSDLREGTLPFLLVGNAGTVGTGAIDPLRNLATIAREHNLWYHIDGAYGGFAAVVPDAHPDFIAMAQADSVAVDPHKWLYAPLEAGCALVRDPSALRETFSYHPTYYQFDNKEAEPINYHEYGPQNSRIFRALKVWMALKQAGRTGYERMIADDIALARRLFEELPSYPDLQALTHGLSITTFRYAPADKRDGSAASEEYLNKLNTELLARLQSGGQVFPSNAVVAGKFALRVCIVNFRTTLDDVMALPGVVTTLGAEIEQEWKHEEKSKSSKKVVKE